MDHPCKETCSGWRQGFEQGKLGYDQLFAQTEKLVEALGWYAEPLNWKYTTYSNLHTMADDARTVEFRDGSYDVSGSRAEEALTEWRSYLDTIKESKGEE